MKNIKLLILLSFWMFCFGTCKQDNRPVSPEKKDVGISSTETIPDNNEPDKLDREVWQKPDLIINKLGNLSDKIVADIGAGTGYFSFRFALKAKKVIAVDIDTSALSFIEKNRKKLPQEYQEKLETRIAKVHDPNLGNEEVDIILIINTIAYINDIPAYLQNIRKALKKNGEIMIVDYKMKKLPINAPPKKERIYLDKVEEMLESAGFTKIVTDDTSLDYQYIITAINS
jgi:ubiquinone/menaquinone biosynthesis C-methylase UbiE